MSEIKEKILRKVESSLNAFQNEDMQKHRLKEVVNFKIYQQDNEYVIGVRSQIKGQEIISKDDILKKIEDYYFKNGCAVHFLLDGKVLMRSLIRFLMKESLPSELENKFIKTFFTVPHLHTYADLLGYVQDHINKDSKLTEKGKSISFQILSEVGKEISPYGGSWGDNSYFLSQIRCLEKFSITVKEYPALHNFFNVNQEIINGHSEVQSRFASFLKNKIPVKDWEQFNAYLNKGEKSLEKNEDIFEEVNNPSYHLLINKSAVLHKHPVLSLHTDYSSMINVLVSNINKHSDSLNLKYCSRLDFKGEKTDLYFLSKDDVPVDSIRIKKLFSFFLNEYSSAMMNDVSISEDFLKKLFSAALMQGELDNQNNDNNPNKKINKI